MYEVIKSNQNKWIKHIKSLQQKKYRDEYGEYLLEGGKLLKEALAFDCELTVAAFSESFLDDQESREFIRVFKEKGIIFHIVEDRLFSDICETSTPQGIIAAAAKPVMDISDILEQDAYALVVLDEVRDPGNVGTIIRTADACNLSAVILSKGCADVYGGKTVRSAMGSIFHIPVFADMDIEALIAQLNQAEVHTVGAEPHARENFFEMPAMKRVAVFIGNESKGLRESVMEKLSAHVSIPMPGRAESLNAAVAASLMMYEIGVRKKCNKE